MLAPQDHLSPSPADPVVQGIEELPASATIDYFGHGTVDNLLKITVEGVPLHVRPNTWDADIASEVIEHDFYLLRLWQPLRPPRYIVDVGAHIGSFSAFAARMFPQAQVVGCEAVAANALLAHLNTQSLPNVRLCHEAVWSYDGVLQLSIGEGPNTGGHSACSSAETSPDHVDSPAVTLTTLTRRHAMDRIDFLKLDCEGAEWEIVPQVNGPYGVPVDLIAMELHLDPPRGRTLPAMRDLLQARFLAVHIRETASPQLWRIHAMRRRP